MAAVVRKRGSYRSCLPSRWLSFVVIPRRRAAAIVFSVANVLIALVLRVSVSPSRLQQLSASTQPSRGTTRRYSRPIVASSRHHDDDGRPVVVPTTTTFDDDRVVLAFVRTTKTGSTSMMGYLDEYSGLTSLYDAGARVVATTTIAEEGAGGGVVEDDGDGSDGGRLVVG